MAPTKKINVYEIGEYSIGAESADHAFSQYVDNGGLDNVFVEEPDGGETIEVTTSIKKLSENRVKSNGIQCCAEGDCSHCADKGDFVEITFEELIASKEDKDFPCVLGKEI